jgi:hypothetical protein
MHSVCTTCNVWKWVQDCHYHSYQVAAAGVSAEEVRKAEEMAAPEDGSPLDIHQLSARISRWFPLEIDLDN